MRSLYKLCIKALLARVMKESSWQVVDESAYCLDAEAFLKGSADRQLGIWIAGCLHFERILKQRAQAEGFLR